MPDLATILHQLFANETARAMTSGAIVLSLLGWIGYQLRALPGQIIHLVEQQFTTSLIVQGDDMPFPRLNEWLAKHPMTRRSRRLAVVSWYDIKNERMRFDMTPGPGRHFLREGDRWFMVQRELRQPGQAQSGEAAARGAPAQASGGIFGRQESITMTILGRSHAPLQALLEKLDQAKADEKRIRVPIYGWAGGGYGSLGERPKRPLDTIYCEDDVKAGIKTDLETFMERRAWCAERGIPWRRGYLLIGPPGTGKTSLIFALASWLDTDVFTINPSSLYTDNSLMEALNYSRPGGFFVMEDVDSIEVLKARPNLEKVRAQQERAQEHAPDEMAVVGRARALGHSAPPSSTAQPPQRIVVDPMSSSLTLSGFLNAVDGLAGAEGRILFMTCNCPDDLDPAMLRAGRIDRVFHLGPAQAAQARAMFARFFPDADADAFARMIGPKLPMAQAELQNLMLALAEAGDPIGALQGEIERRLAA